MRKQKLVKLTKAEIRSDLFKIVSCRDCSHIGSFVNRAILDACLRRFEYLGKAIFSLKMLIISCPAGYVITYVTW